ncbi:unnamed protein product, partial [Ceratitis capitata]
ASASSVRTIWCQSMVPIIGSPNYQLCWTLMLTALSRRRLSSKTTHPKNHPLSTYVFIYVKNVRLFALTSSSLCVEQQQEAHLSFSK